MTRRTTRAAVASLGAATLLVASLGGTFAQSPSAAAPAGEAASMPAADIALGNSSRLLGSVVGRNVTLSNSQTLTLAPGPQLKPPPLTCP